MHKNEIAKKVGLFVLGVIGGLALVVAPGGKVPSASGAQDCQCSLAGPVTVSAVTAPITVAGPIKAITADTDIDQIQVGVADGRFGVSALMVTGPFVITDLRSSGLGVGPGTVTVGPGNACPPLSTTYTTFVASQQDQMGLRFPVPAGSVACQTLGAVQWGGYRPY